MGLGSASLAVALCQLEGLSEVFVPKKIEFGTKVFFFQFFLSLQRGLANTAPFQKVPLLKVIPWP